MPKNRDNNLQGCVDMSILNLLASDNFIVVNKTLSKNIGLVESFLYGELISEYRYYLRDGRLDNDGMFFSTVENIENNTGIKRDQQTYALNRLVQLGLIDTKKKGLPAKRYIKIIDDEDVISKFLSENYTPPVNPPKARNTQKTEKPLTREREVGKDAEIPENGQRMNDDVHESRNNQKTEKPLTSQRKNRQHNNNNIKVLNRPLLLLSEEQTESSATQNLKTNLLGNMSLNDLETENITPKEIENLFTGYFGTSLPERLLPFLMELTDKEINKIFDTLISKQADGAITNPVGLLVKNPGPVIDSILHGQLYSHSKNKAGSVIKEYTTFERETGISMEPQARQNIYDKWHQEWGFSHKVIIKAGEIMCLYTNSGGMGYIDRILQQWQQKGIHSLEDIDNALSDFKNQKTVNTNKQRADYSDKRDSSEYELYVPPELLEELKNKALDI